MSVYLGIDLGTTGLKSVLVREDGTICAVGYREYPISIPQTGYAEQDPEDWWKALRESLREAMNAAGINGSEVKGVGLSGQMHGTVLLDRFGKMLYPAIIWCDQRSAKEADEIRARLGRQRLGELTQNPVSSGFQICSLLWMKKHLPDVYGRIDHVLLPKDYLRFRMTGCYGTEPTDACSTLMFDSARRNWSSEMLDAFDIDSAILPDVAESPMRIHEGLTEKAAVELGLKPGIPVVYGGGDQPMHAIGNGIIAPGNALITLGTGGQIFVPSASPVYDPSLRVHTFCHADRHLWYVMGAILNCCLAQNWFANKVLDTHDYAAVHCAAAEVPAGSNGLFFLPYLTGERTPHLDARAKGVFWGLTLEHDRASMARAVIEGISYALSDAMDCILQTDQHVDKLVLSGGGARSVLWKQMIADMLGQPIYTTCMKEAAGVGAAICAMVGTGAYSSLNEACGAIIRYEEGFIAPNRSNSEFYQSRKVLFRAIYQANQTLFPSL